jgi:hypothetical protein
MTPPLKSLSLLFVIYTTGLVDLLKFTSDSLYQNISFTFDYVLPLDDVKLQKKHPLKVIQLQYTTTYNIIQNLLLYARVFNLYIHIHHVTYTLNSYIYRSAGKSLKTSRMKK